MNQAQNSPATRRQLRVRGTPTEKDSGTKQTPTADKETPSSSTGVKMRTRLSTGTLIMNGTSTVKEKDIRTPPSTPSADSPKAWKDNTTSTSKRKAASSSSSSESPAVVPPKLRKIVRKEGQEEGTMSDEYCWLCHKDGATINCHLCPRSFHMKCLNMTSIAKEWVCTECTKIMQEECKQGVTKAVAQISTDSFCLLLRYALDRMRQPGSDIFQQPVDSAVLPNYTDYIFRPMDFTILEKNIRNKEYGCTDAFLADAKWILHNCIIFNGVHHKLTTVARNVVKSCKHEMSEIEVCPQCYEHSCLYTDGSWFVEPCEPPHTIVWAKLKGYPFWPAKALQEVNGQVDVRFFGAHDMSWIPVSQVFLLSKESPTGNTKNRKGFFAAALEELEEHINILKAKYGGYDYAPCRTPFDRRNVYMNNKLKSVNKRFKSPGFVKLTIRGKELEKVSAVSKTASALKSKYNTMASKKSTSIQVQGRPFPSAITQTSSSCESSPEKAAQPAESADSIVRREGARAPVKQTARKSFTILNPVVTMRDIIESKILQRKELEEISEDEKDDVDAREETVVPEKDGVCRNEAEKASTQSDGGRSTTASEVEPSSDERVTGSLEEELTGSRSGVGEDEVKNKEVVKSQNKENLVASGREDLSSNEETTKRSSGEQETSAGGLGAGRKVEETPQSTRHLPEGEITSHQVVTVQVLLDTSEDKAGKNASQTENGTQKNPPTTTNTTESTGKGDSMATAIIVPTCPTSPSSQKNPPTTTNTTESTGKGDSIATAIIVPTCPTTPSSTATPSSVAMEISPKSGMEYKDALLKTIEACKGKLGISEVTDIEEVTLDASDDDDDDEEDSGDSKEGGSTSDSASGSMKTDGRDPPPSAIDSETVRSTCTPDANISAHAEQQPSASSRHVSSPGVISSGVADTSSEASTSVSALDVKKPSGRSDEATEVSHIASKPDSAVVSFKPVSQSGSHTVTSKLDSVALSSKSVLQSGSPAITPKLDSVAVSSKPVSQSGSLPITPKLDSVAVSSKPVSQSGSLTVPPDHVSVLSEPISQSSSLPVTAQEDCVAESSRPVSQSASELEHAAGITRLKSLLQFTRVEKNDSVTAVPTSKPVTVAYSNHSTTSDLAASSADKVSLPGSGVSDLAASSADKVSLPGSGVSKTKPITIEDDDEEPGLLMEVEAGEDEDSLIIDLDEDDIDLTSGSSRSDDFPRELAPSPSLMKSVPKRSNANIFKKNSNKQRKKSDTGIPASTSPTARVPSPKASSSSAKSSSSPLPGSALSAPCVLVDVRSLSGMDHDWKTSDSSRGQAHSQTQKPGQACSQAQNQGQACSQAHKQGQAHTQAQKQGQACSQAHKQGQAQSQAHKQGQSQAQGEEQGQAQPEAQQAGQTMAGPYPSAYTFRFKRPAAPTATPTRQTQSVPVTSSPTTPTSTSSASPVSAQRSRPGHSVEEANGTERQGLTAAAVSLVNKYSQQLVSNTQIQLAEMCRELLSSCPSETENEQRLQEQKEQLQWIHEKQVAEIQHDFKMTFAEMKACWEAEKSKAISDMKKKLIKEKEDAVAETKKKQWCAHCWKEALYYCCWNTTYCSYTCQQSHWAVHQDTCRQAVDTATTVTPTITTTTTSETVGAAIVGTKSKELELVASGNSGMSAAEAEERIKAQTFNLAKPSSGHFMNPQGEDVWRNRLPLPTQTLGMGQSIHFLPAQQPAPSSSQPVQQLQYLHNLGTGQTTFQTNPQVQLRPALNAMLPAGTVLPSNTMVFPFLRNSQPATLQGQATNVILNRPVHCQPTIWKNF